MNIKINKINKLLSSLKSKKAILQMYNEMRLQKRNPKLKVKVNTSPFTITHNSLATSTVQ